MVCRSVDLKVLNPYLLLVQKVGVRSELFWFMPQLCALY
jgi:hypothetical protein